MPQTEVLTRILDKVEYLVEKMDKCEKILTGNGSPEKGMIVRLDRLEGKAKRATWIIATLFGAIVMAGCEYIFKLL